MMHPDDFNSIIGILFFSLEIYIKIACEVWVLILYSNFTECNASVKYWSKTSFGFKILWGGVTKTGSCYHRERFKISFMLLVCFDKFR